MNDASTPDVTVGDTAAEASPLADAGAGFGCSDHRYICPAGVSLSLLPILIPIIAALLLSMLLATFVGLLERIGVPRTLDVLIVVVAAVGASFAIAAGLRGPTQSSPSEPRRFSHLEERLRPITGSFEIFQYTTEQLEKVTARRDWPSI
jgi:predicted PurR-regulated permease PerM